MSLAFVAIAVVLGAPAVAQQAAALIDLDDYLEHAARFHPELEAAAAQVEAQQQQARAQSALPDPKLAWGEMIVPVETRVGPQRRVFSLSQGIPWPGTLGLKQEIGLAKAAVRAERLTQLEAEIRRRVRSAWYQLAWVQDEKRLVESHLSLVRQTEASQRARYESGAGSYASILEAQMEAARLENRLLDLDDQARRVHSSLLSAAGVTTSPMIPQAELPNLSERDSATSDRQRLLTLLIGNSPKLSGLKEQENASRLQVALAGRTSYPGFVIGVDYIQTDSARMPDVENSGRDPIIARMAVSLPLWGGKTVASRAEAAGRLQAAGADRRALELELARELDAILARMEIAQREIELHESELLPRARQVVEILRADLASSRTEFVTLLAARRSLLQLELEQLRAAHSLAQARCDLVALLNTNWNELEEAPATSVRKDEGS